MKKYKKSGLVCVIAGVATAAAMSFGLGQAKATPQQDMIHDASLFCTWVHNDPTPRGVVNAVAEFVEQGVDYNTSTATISFALTNVCPEYQGLFARTNAIINGGTQVA
jgi:hypothetical protein